jgi:hypothetical protein
LVGFCEVRGVKVRLAIIGSTGLAAREGVQPQHDGGDAQGSIQRDIAACGAPLQNAETSVRRVSARIEVSCAS